jgi:hypothetical protein
VHSCPSYFTYVDEITRIHFTSSPLRVAGFAVLFSRISKETEENILAEQLGSPPSRDTKDGPGRPSSLLQTRMPQANPKEGCPSAQKDPALSASACARQRKAATAKRSLLPSSRRQGKTATAKALSASAWLRHASSDREGSRRWKADV